MRRRFTKGRIQIIAISAVTIGVVVLLWNLSFWLVPAGSAHYPYRPVCDTPERQATDECLSDGKLSPN